MWRYVRWLFQFCSSFSMSALILGHSLSSKHGPFGILNESSEYVLCFSNLWSSNSKLFFFCTGDQQKYPLFKPSTTCFPLGYWESYQTKHCSWGSEFWGVFVSRYQAQSSSYSRTFFLNLYLLWSLWILLFDVSKSSSFFCFSRCSTLYRLKEKRWYKVGLNPMNYHHSKIESSLVFPIFWVLSSCFK